MDEDRTFWEQRFARQARWTKAVRLSLYRRANLLRARRVLEVGCGPGVIAEELQQHTRGRVVALDRDFVWVATARRRGVSRGVQADALALPFADGVFDVVVCHFLLLWLPDPVAGMREMARVVRSGGAVLVCAEPDYGGRVDWPPLAPVRWQVEGLRRKGANPLIGRQLRALIVQAGLRGDVGVIPSVWKCEDLRAHFEEEWALLAWDVAGLVTEDALRQAREEAHAAIERGERFLFLPIFYALARK